MFVVGVRGACALAALLALCSLAAAREGEDCPLFTASNGTCVPLNECPQVVDLIRKNEINMVRKLHCGWKGNEPLVCCTKYISSHINPLQPTTLRTSEIVEESGINNVTETTTTVDPEQIYNKDDSYVDELSPAIVPPGPPPTSPEPAALPLPSQVQVEDTHNRHHENFTVDMYNESSLLPGLDACGLTNQLANRIYGGTLPEIDEFPWMAQISYLKGGQILFLCGGTLISNRYVVTAAHCLQVPYKLVGVRLGEFNMSTPVDCVNDVCNEGPLDVGVEQTIHHAEFSRRTPTKYDIGLLRLSHAVNFTDFVRPICLPLSDYARRHDYIPEASYTSAGWGKTLKGKYSEALQKVVLRAVSMDICQVAVPVVGRVANLSGIICAGGRLAEDTCTGDSGGPLMRTISENYTNHWYLYGITSFGVGCGREGSPSVYTRVSKYTDWIVSNLRP